jgi:hypothetical protein
MPDDQVGPLPNRGKATAALASVGSGASRTPTIAPPPVSERFLCNSDNERALILIIQDLIIRDPDHPGRWHPWPCDGDALHIHTTSGIHAAHGLNAQSRRNDHGNICHGAA